MDRGKKESLYANSSAHGHGRRHDRIQDDDDLTLIISKCPGRGGKHKFVINTMRTCVRAMIHLTMIRTELPGGVIELRTGGHIHPPRRHNRQND